MKPIGQLGKKTWDIIRKPTTPVHLVYGLFCAYLVYEFGFLVGMVMMLAFAGWEWWNDHELFNRQLIKKEWGLELEVKKDDLYLPEGAMDWWESSVTFCIGLFVLGILQNLGHICVCWLW